MFDALIDRLVMSVIALVFKKPGNLAHSSNAHNAGRCGRGETLRSWIADPPPRNDCS
jgi:hypothetical protein